MMLHFHLAGSRSCYWIHFVRATKKRETLPYTLSMPTLAAYSARCMRSFDEGCQTSQMNPQRPVAAHIISAREGFSEKPLPCFSAFVKDLVKEPLWLKA